MNNAETTRCEYCNGELDYHALPKAINKHGKPISTEFATVRICKKCGKAHYPDVVKERLQWKFPK